MECPFELPVEKRIRTNGFCKIKDAKKRSIAYGLTEDEADYIVQAINSHEKLVKALQYLVADHPAGLLPNKSKSLLQAVDVLKEAEKT